MKDSVRYRDVEGHPQAALIRVLDGLVGTRGTSIKRLVIQNWHLLEAAISQGSGDTDLSRWTADGLFSSVNEMLASAYEELQKETLKSLEKGAGAGAAETMAAATAIGFVTVRLPLDLSEPFRALLSDRKPKVGGRQEDAGAWIFYSRQNTANGFRENYQIQCVTRFAERLISPIEGQADKLGRASL